jgi:diguanylate cyclase (GGDEF)-like protein
LTTRHDLLIEKVDTHGADQDGVKMVETPRYGTHDRTSGSRKHPTESGATQVSIGGDRLALGLAFSERLDDVADIQMSLVDGAPASRPMALAASQTFCTWLMTGKADLPVIGEFARQGASNLAQDDATLREMTRLALAWRDAVVFVLGEEAARLGLPEGVREEMVIAARKSCDAFGVQLATQYDRERAELQAALAESRAQLVYRATHDPLTGLENRSSFFDRLEEVARSTLDRSEAVAVLFVDLDRFKLINDRFGHHRGDSVLKVAAERLRSVIRPGDMLARLGGDEFVILCGGIGEADAADVATRIANRIKSAFVAPFTVAESKVCISASIGIAVDRSTEGDPEAMVVAADEAMYVAKARGGTSCEIELAE